MLEAVQGEQTLHSVATGSGGNAVANITPLTELLVAHLAGQEPKTYFASIAGSSSTLSSAVTADAVSGATAAVVATLQDAGVTVTGLADLVGGELKAGSNQGYDGVLEELAGKLTQTGGNLATLTSAVAAASPVASSGSSGSAPTATAGEADASGMLPASLQLRAKAADCASLRSGKYRLVVLKPWVARGPTDPVTTTDVATLDAAASAGPTWTYGDQSTETMTPVANDRCHYRYTSADGDYDFTVAPSGIGFGRSKTTYNGNSPDPLYRLVIALPEQSIPVTALAGKWNVLGWDKPGSSFIRNPGIVTIGSNASVSASCSRARSRRNRPAARARAHTGASLPTAPAATTCMPARATIRT